MTQIFARAFDLLRRNWIIVLPSLLLGIAGAAVTQTLSASGRSSWAFFGDINAQGADVFWMFLATIVAFGVRILGALVAIAFTTGMAGAAWMTGRARLSDGLTAFRQRGVQAFVALVVLFAVGLAAAALVVPTFGVSVLVYAIFVVYTMPSVIVGGRPASDGVIESIRIAAQHFGITFALVVMSIVLAAAGGLAGAFASRIPFLGEAVGWIVMEAVVAYATLAVVGVYVRANEPSGPARGSDPLC